MDVGFIGLGKMGRAMAARLLVAGHQVRVWNRSPAAVEALVREGATAAATPKAAFAGDAVISMLADDEAVRAAILAGGVLDEQARGTIHVNMATVSVTLAKELAARHEAHEVAYVAAPVFGRPDAAAAGKLHIVAAGAAVAVEKVQPLFEAIGQRTWRLGDEAYRANVVKLAGNFMLAAAIEAMAEAAAMAEANGVAPGDMLEVLTGTLFAAPAYQGYGALIAERRYEPAGFRLQLGLKDVRLALAAAEAENVPLPFASVLRDNFLDALAHGDEAKDWAALAEVAARRAGLKREP